MRLTRYLYIKDEVEASFVRALTERTDVYECYFWIFELVESGYDDVTQLLWRVFYDYYFEYYPKLECYIRRKFVHYARSAYVVHLLHVVRQLFALTASYTVYQRRIGGATEAPTLGELVEKFDATENVEDYWNGASNYGDTAHRLLAMEAQLCVPEDELPEIVYVIGGSFPSDVSTEEVRPDRVLSHVRRYKTDDTPFPHLNWEYYAYDTPCWNERFCKYGGVPDHTKKRVVFANDDGLEAFYEKYGYEPDEQSAALGFT